MDRIHLFRRYMESRIMGKLRLANVAVLFIMILVMVLVDCEMVRPTNSTTFKFRLKAQAPEPAPVPSMSADSVVPVDFSISPKTAWISLSPS
jgi:hypothetical protein